MFSHIYDLYFLQITPWSMSIEDRSVYTAKIIDVYTATIYSYYKFNSQVIKNRMPKFQESTKIT